MTKLPDRIAARWHALEDGTVLFFVSRDETRVISRPNLDRIIRAKLHLLAAISIAILAIFFLNGIWWSAGYRGEQFAVLLFLVALVPLGFVTRYGLVRNAILEDAPLSEIRLEPIRFWPALEASVSRRLMSGLKSRWLIAILALGCVGIFGSIWWTIEFISLPVVRHYGRGHPSGPLDGIFALILLLIVLLFVSRELYRRHGIRPRR